MTRVIGIVSGKGGVGKTTTVINLSTALMEFNKKVIALDADVKMSGLGLQLGMYHFPFTLNDVLMGKGKLFEALYIHSSGLRIIPASLSSEDVNIYRMKEVLQDQFLEDNIVLVDGPPGLEKNAIATLRVCPEVLIVTIPEMPAIVDALKVISVCRGTNTKIIGIIVNMYKNREVNQISTKEIESTFELPVIGVVPEDRDIKRGIFKGMSCVLFNPYSSASIAYKKIAAHLVGEQYKPPRYLMLKRLFRGLKK
ncbi:MAG: cell division ATPase MinD [Candidatus Aenigmarchaeota archaeon]|nr:cell division ATPase MinD [Candidatus Aenigmarchaeota archaeon]